MIYTIDNIEEIKDIYLHDYESLNINIDYINKSMVLALKSPEGIEKKIKVNQFYFLSVDRFEPWGEGFYINSFEINKDILNNQFSSNNIFSLEILINSGDKILIYSERLLLE